MKNKIHILILIILTMMGCSRQRMTTSKIKLFGSNVFSGNLATKANNGLIIYGHSNDGKSFLKKIDVDSVDLEFPNGIWNFYAVAWEQAAPSSLFQGTTVCGKSENINLNGTDVTINLSLTNANCADASFSANTDTVSVYQTLPNRHFVSCRDLGSISSYSDQANCGRATYNNRGYATYLKIFIPQYKDFGKGLEEYNTTMQTACIKLNTTIDISEEVASQPGGMIHPNQLHFPDSINGFRMGLRVYYTPNDTLGCDDASGIDELNLPLQDTPRSKTFFTKPGSSQSPIGHVYFQSNESQICQGPRLGTTYFAFAGGAGSNFSPYVICTPSQFNNIDNNFTNASLSPTPQNGSFELAADLNFNFGTFQMIGNSISGDQTSSALNWNGLLFEGNKHTMEKILLQTTASNVVGVIRNAASAQIQNLTLNKVAIVATSAAEVGGLVGETNQANLKNIRVHGHVEGNSLVGGVVGKVTVGTTFDNVHGLIDVKGDGGTVGGLVGGLYATSSSSISNSSASGEVRSNSQYLGGIVGRIDAVTAITVTLNKIISKVDINGSTDLGGVVGISSGSGNFNLQNAYVQGGIYSNGGQNAGDVIGTAGATGANSFYNVLGFVVKGGQSTSNFGGIYGSLTGAIGCTGVTYYLQDGTNSFGGTCNLSTNEKATQDTLAVDSRTALVALADANWNMLSSGDIPRLTYETGMNSYVPYLDQTECDGHYAIGNILGNGSQTTPYIICSAAQFANISAGNFYVMNRNVYFGSTEAQSPKIAGVYHVNGNGNGVYGLKITSNTTGDNGFISSLQSGSAIEKLTVFGASTTIPSTIISDYSLGILAGKNNGTITGLKFIKSKINFAGGTYASSSAGTQIAIGGLVGINDSSGSISHLKSNITADFTKSSYGSSTSQVYFGGTTGLNYGMISDSKIQDSFKLDPFYIITPEHYAGISAVNAGTIQRVIVNTNQSLNAYASTGGAFKLGAVVDVNNGLVQDLLVAGNFYLNNITSFTNGFLVSEPSGGSSFNRVIFYPSIISGYTFGSASALMPASGSTTESFCIHSTITGCMASTTGQFSFTSPNFTAGSFFTNSNNWNMVDSSSTSTSYTWKFTSANSIPELKDDEGGVETLGTGF